MKLTKKQLSALQRIVGREQTRYDETQSEALAGVHSSEKHFAITDGTMVVLFAEQPEGISVSSVLSKRPVKRLSLCWMGFSSKTKTLPALLNIGSACGKLIIRNGERS